jgi:hypothetical protein
VTDAQGIVTLVKLVEPQFGIGLDPELFIFHDPRQPVQRPAP